MAENLKQTEFVWKGKDRSGKVIKGEISAYSETIARAELRRQGTRIIGLKKKPKPLFSKAKSSISPKDIAVFSRQLATML
ncbi:MAG: type II secretion system F family protein, partial [Gammaproteobacteria bacterium]